MDDYRAIREYIREEACRLGQAHGKRKCPDAEQCNPFEESFLNGAPWRFWNEVYGQAARRAAADLKGHSFSEEMIQNPSDLITENELDYMRRQIIRNQKASRLLDDISQNDPDDMVPLVNRHDAELEWYGLGLGEDAEPARPLNDVEVVSFESHVE